MIARGKATAVKTDTAAIKISKISNIEKPALGEAAKATGLAKTGPKRSVSVVKRFFDGRNCKTVKKIEKN